jgi:hypothetical protein
MADSTELWQSQIINHLTKELSTIREILQTIDERLRLLEAQKLKDFDYSD